MTKFIVPIGLMMVAFPAAQVVREHTRVVPRGTTVTQSQAEGTYWFHGTMTSSTNGVGTVYCFD